MDPARYLHRPRAHRARRLLRDDPDLRFEMCLGTNGVHYPLDKGREAMRHLPVLVFNRLIRLEVICPDSTRASHSTVSVYPANDWQRRETWDLIGIIFTGRLPDARVPND